MGLLCVNVKVSISAIMMLLLNQALGSLTDPNKSLNNTVTVERDVNGLQSPFYGRITFAVLSLIMSCSLSAMFGKWRL